MTGVGVVSPYGTDKEAMGGGRRSRLDSVMQYHDTVAGNCLLLVEVKLPGFLPELAGGQISSIPSFVILREIFVVTSADSSAS